MKSIMAKMAGLGAILLSLFLFTACESNGSAEELGEDLDEAVEDAAEAAEDAGDEAADRLD